MITGDIKETAQSIGQQIGFFSVENNENSFTGVEYEHLSPEKQQEVLLKCLKSKEGLVFSRTEPRHKKILVKELSNMVLSYIVTK